MHHLKIYFPGLESVLFRTHSYCCRVPERFSRGDRTKLINLCGDDADSGLTDPGEWILVLYSLPLRGV